MSVEELAQRVIGVIAKARRVPPETITPETTFQELGLDSLDAVNVLFALEEEFNVSIPDEDAREIRTVRQVIEGIAKLVAPTPAGGTESFGEQPT
ncbi:MAG: acyl carrier protein [Bryobacterales bacterium]|nr:acyl carrier protein [Bryobacteraceae bacterium]MDW8354902.1 acyl carrier protein [Bryobacterales bacterium]